MKLNDSMSADPQDIIYAELQRQQEVAYKDYVITNKITSMLQVGVEWVIPYMYHHYDICDEAHPRHILIIIINKDVTAFTLIEVWKQQKEKE